MLSFLKPESGTGWSERLKQGLFRTRELLNRDLGKLWRNTTINAAWYDELETTLLAADVGVAATQSLLAILRRADCHTPEQLKQTLRSALLELLQPVAMPLDIAAPRPFIIMLVGVNGVGKTTSIGKIAHYYQQQGKSVLLAAGDTFRAAAREQLEAWGQRNNITVITQQSGDAAAVIFDATNAARARGIDLVLADTAGRLPTQLHLMEEIKKVKRVIAKALPGAPHEVMLVLDANTGQNALNQVEAFDDALGVTGITLTKLDGTAKGGVLAAVARHKPIPLRFIGVGEGRDDLQPFVAEEFVDALLG
jgi:fused signal recognition particle receptor